MRRKTAMATDKIRTAANAPTMAPVLTKDSFVSIGDSVVLRVEAVDKQISLNARYINQRRVKGRKEQKKKKKKKISLKN